MEFGGPTPPLDDKYCPSVLTEAVWKRIEKGDISYKEDIRGWRQKFEDEKDNIDNFANEIAARLTQWFEETDFAIRTLRCCKEDTLVQFYQAQMVEQKVYMKRLEQRRLYLEQQLIIMNKEISKEEEEKKKEKKKEKREKKAGKKANTSQDPTEVDLSSAVLQLQL